MCVSVVEFRLVSYNGLVAGEWTTCRFSVRCWMNFGIGNHYAKLWIVEISLSQLKVVWCKRAYFLLIFSFAVFSLLSLLYVHLDTFVHVAWATFLFIPSALSPNFHCSAHWINKKMLIGEQFNSWKIQFFSRLLFLYVYFFSCHARWDLLNEFLLGLFSNFDATLTY